MMRMTAYIFARNACIAIMMLASCTNSSVSPDGDLDSERAEMADTERAEMGDSELADNPSDGDTDISDGDATPDVDGDTPDGDKEGDADPDTDSGNGLHFSECLYPGQNSDPAWSDLLIPGETRLSTIGLSDGLDPLDINGDWVVWGHGGDGRLFAYRVSTGCAVEISASDVPGWGYWVTVDNGIVYTLGNKVKEGIDFQLYKIDLTEKTYKALNPDVFNIQTNYPHARNGRLVLQYISQIRLYDDPEKEDVFHTQSERVQNAPKLSDKYLVWENPVGNSSVEIMLYDLTDKSVTSLTPTETDGIKQRAFPSIWGQYVSWTWIDTGDNIWRVFLHNLDSGETIQLNPDDTMAYFTWVDNNRVVWMQDQRIRLRDIPSETNVWVTPPETGGSQNGPRLSGRYLVYTDATRFPRLPGFTRGWDVMLFDLCTLDMYHDDPMCQ
jgi:hypothetical protein